MDNYCTSMVNSTGYVRVQSGNETALLESLARVGPIRYKTTMNAHYIAMCEYIQNTSSSIIVDNIILQ